MDVAQLREARPDLVTSIETEIKESVKQEVKEAMEAIKELEDLKGQVETLTTENGTLKTQIEEAEKEKAKAEAQALIKEAVDKAELPDAAKARLIKGFAGATTDEGLEDAIKAEAEYVRELTEAGKVRNMGSSQESTEAGKEAYRESLKMTHPNWPPEQIELAVIGK